MQSVLNEQNVNYAVPFAEAGVVVVLSHAAYGFDERGGQEIPEGKKKKDSIKDPNHKTKFLSHFKPILTAVVS